MMTITIPRRHHLAIIAGKKLVYSPAYMKNVSGVRSVEMLNEKPSNPKDMIGSDKIPLHLWPTTATVHGSMALLDGASKYGKANFRAIGVRASIYMDAALRHMYAWYEGEDVAEDSGVHHLGHALACMAIILDAMEAGELTDDRVIQGGYKPMMDRLTPLVKQIKAKHDGKNPKHYTRMDNK
jgi:hypothetical protein